MKDADRGSRLEHLYHSALDHSEAERGAFLDNACGADLELRRDVESLIAHDQEAQNFIEVPALEMAARMLARQHNPLPAENGGSADGRAPASGRSPAALTAKIRLEKSLRVNMKGPLI